MNMMKMKEILLVSLVFNCGVVSADTIGKHPALSTTESTTATAFQISSSSDDGDQIGTSASASVHSTSESYLHVKHSTETILHNDTSEDNIGMTAKVSPRNILKSLFGIITVVPETSNVTSDTDESNMSVTQIMTTEGNPSVELDVTYDENKVKYQHTINKNNTYSFNQVTTNNITLVTLAKMLKAIDRETSIQSLDQLTMTTDVLNSSQTVDDTNIILTSPTYSPSTRDMVTNKSTTTLGTFSTEPVNEMSTTAAVDNELTKFSLNVTTGLPTTSPNMISNSSVKNTYGDMTEKVTEEPSFINTTENVQSTVHGNDTLNQATNEILSQYTTEIYEVNVADNNNTAEMSTENVMSTTGETIISNITESYNTTHYRGANKLFTTSENVHSTSDSGENGTDYESEAEITPTKMFSGNNSGNGTIENDSEIFLPKTIATVKPNVKSTTPLDSDINFVEPVIPKPTDPTRNEVGLSTLSTPIASKIPIYTPAVVPSTTETDTFIISLDPVQLQPTMFYPKTTTIQLAANTIKNDPNILGPDVAIVEPTIKSNDEAWLPPLYVEFELLMTQVEVCDKKKVYRFKSIVANLIDVDNKDMKVKYKQIVYKPVDVKCVVSRSHSYGRKKRSGVKAIIVYVKDTRGVYSFELTDQLAGVLHDLGQKSFQGSIFQDKISDIIFHGKKVTSPVVEATSASLATGIIVTIVIVIIVIIVVVAFVSLQLYVRWRRRDVKMMRQVSTGSRQSAIDAQSLADSIQLQAFVRMESGRFSRRRMDRGSFAYVNPGLELLDQKGQTSNPLTFIGLAEMLKEMQDINDEFLMMPNQLATINDLPPGVEEKNRYSNVIPNPKSRVPLHCLSVKDVKEGAEYINANFIRGYQCYPNCYIATQAPLENTVYDFWRMVWQQNSTVIIMLTAMEEQGVEKCVEYWPNTEGGDTTRVYGEYRLSQERRIVMPEWIQTTLLLKYKKAKQQKEIHHFWLTSWPKNGVPDYRTLIKFMVQIRPIMDESAGPPIVHCSPGTGRTGVVIALDICMLQFEDSAIVNVLNTVHQLRKDRGGMVQTKEQYASIYKVVFEYAKMLNNSASSARSSISSTASSFRPN